MTSSSEFKMVDYLQMPDGRLLILHETDDGPMVAPDGDATGDAYPLAGKDLAYFITQLKKKAADEEAYARDLRFLDSLQPPRVWQEQPVPTRSDWRAGAYVVGLGVIIQTIALVAVIWKSAHG